MIADLASRKKQFGLQATNPADLIVVKKALWLDGDMPETPPEISNLPTTTETSMPPAVETDTPQDEVDTPNPTTIQEEPEALQTQDLSATHGGDNKPDVSAGNDQTSPEAHETPAEIPGESIRANASRRRPVGSEDGVETGVSEAALSPETIELLESGDGKQMLTGVAQGLKEILGVSGDEAIDVAKLFGDQLKDPALQQKLIELMKDFTKKGVNEKVITEQLVSLVMNMPLEELPTNPQELNSWLEGNSGKILGVIDESWLKDPSTAARMAQAAKFLGEMVVGKKGENGEKDRQGLLMLLVAALMVAAELAAESMRIPSYLGRE